MKICDIEVFQVAWASDDQPAQRSAWVVIRCEDGLFGIGEASPMQGGLASLGIIARNLAPRLIGADPLDHAVLLDTLLHQLVKLGPEGALSGALAALDIALWDVKGKLFGQPIYKLLGGAWRTALPFYASIGGNGERSPSTKSCASSKCGSRTSPPRSRSASTPTAPGPTAISPATSPRRARCGDWSATVSRWPSTPTTATRSAVRSASAARSKSSAIGGSRSRCSTTM